MPSTQWKTSTGTTYSPSNLKYFTYEIHAEFLFRTQHHMVPADKGGRTQKTKLPCVFFTSQPLVHENVPDTERTKLEGNDTQNTARAAHTYTNPTPPPTKHSGC